MSADGMYTQVRVGESRCGVDGRLNRSPWFVRRNFAWMRRSRGGRKKVGNARDGTYCTDAF